MPIRKHIVSEGAVHLVKDDPLPLVTKGNDLGEGQGGAVGGHHVVGYTGEDGVRRADTCDAEGYVVATYVGKHCEVFAQAAADALDRAALHVPAGEIEKRRSAGADLLKRLPRLGSGERHRRLVARLRERGDVKDPEAVAAAIGRAKWGKGRYQRLAAKGRKRAARSK